MMAGWIRELHNGTRALLRSPGFTATAVLTLALGVGATTAIFSVVSTVLLRELPYAEPERLVMIWERNADEDRNLASPLNFLAWKEQARSFEALSAVNTGSVTLTGSGPAEWLRTVSVSSGFFRLLGVPLALGRELAPAEDRPGGDPGVVLSHELWQRRFGGDREVLGRSLSLDGRLHTVLGVAPPGFELLAPADVWLPIALDPANPSKGRYLTTVGRLRPDIGLEQARAEMTTIAGRQTALHPDVNTGWGVTVLPLREHLVGETRPVLWMLMGAVVFVLLIACTNVSNLLLSRSLSRQREFAVRTALGAGGRQLAAQVLAEGWLIALAAGLLGLAFAWASARVMSGIASEILPALARVAIDGPVMAFALALTFLVVPLFGLAPVVAALRPDLQQGLKEGGRSTGGRPGRWLRNAAVVCNFALALVLLIGAGLMTESLRRLQRVDLGFRPERILTFRTSVPMPTITNINDLVPQFEQVAERLERLPGVRSVSAVSFLPLAGFGAGTTFTLEGRPAPPPGQEPVSDLRFATPGYFTTMGIPLERGRDFTPQDNRDAPFAVIVGRHLADTYWPGEDPLGRRIQMQWADMVDGQIVPLAITATVVGVAGDIREQGYQSEVKNMLYWPLRQLPWNPVYFAIKTGSDPEALSPLVRREVQAVNPDFAVYDVATLEDLLVRSEGRRRLAMTLLAVFSALAVGLAAVGIYSAVSYAVGQRTREIGIRLALGSPRSGILLLILGSGLRLALAGLLIGLPLAFLLARSLSSLLYEIQAVDLRVYAVLSVLLVAIGLLASFLPARRASRRDPGTVLRTD